MFKKLLGITPEPQIHAYYGFGSAQSVFVTGRVTESLPEPEVKVKYSAWNNFLVFITSYLAQPLSNVEIEVTFAGKTMRTQTDALGFYELVMPLSSIAIPDKSSWMEGSVKVFRHSDETPFAVMMRGRSVQFGVISDIDDTILISNATNKFRLIYSTMFKHASARRAFPGVVELYRRLRKGDTGTQTNPFFYVSSSHWNLFTFLTTFFQLNTLPQGPLLLKRTAGIRSAIRSVGNHAHKEMSMQKILELFPDTSFILIGDSGQKDARIYASLFEKYPDRIKEIYIRDVTKYDDPVVLESQKRLGSQKKIVVVQSSEEIAMHAQKHGYIK